MSDETINPRVWRYKPIPDKPSVIYVIKPDGLDYVKVGQTRDLYPRMSTIQTGCPHELRILFVLLGGTDEEARIHFDLGAHRERGEWFRLNAETQAVLDRLRADAIDYDAMMDGLLEKARLDKRAAIAAMVAR